MKKTIVLLSSFIICMTILFSFNTSNINKVNAAVALPPAGYDLYDYDLDMSELKNYYDLNTGAGFNNEPLNVYGYDTNYINLSRDLLELPYSSNMLLGFSFISINKPLFATAYVVKMDNTFVTYDVSMFVGQEGLQFKTYAFALCVYDQDITSALSISIRIRFEDVVSFNTIFTPSLNSDIRFLNTGEKMNIITTYSQKYWAGINETSNNYDNMSFFDLFYYLFVDYIFISNIPKMELDLIPQLFASVFTFAVIAIPIYFIIRWIFGSKRK